METSVNSQMSAEETLTHHLMMLDKRSSRDNKSKIKLGLNTIYKTQTWMTLRE